MTETVSKPNHHSDKVPTREERDNAFSKSGGRKAVEELKDQIEKESCAEEEAEAEAAEKKSCAVENMKKARAEKTETS